MSSPELNTPPRYRLQLDAAGMSSLQWRAIALCFVLNMIDGIDVLVMAFTASAVSQAWQLSPVALGWLFSAGIIGMTIGSLFFAPLADRYGRRTVVIVGMLSTGLMMVLTHWVGNAWALGVLRGLTGVGIGAVLVNANVLTSEYSNAKWRALNIALQSVGFAVGATLGGLMAAYLLTHGTWQDVFVWGGVLSVGTALLVAVALPESLDVLLLQHRQGDHTRARALLRRMGHSNADAWDLTVPSPSQRLAQRSPWQALRLLWGPGCLHTWLLGTSFLTLMFCFYFVTNWTPKLLEQAGLSAQHGVAGGVLLHVGGMAGALALGVCASRWHLQKVTVCLMAAGSAALLGIVPSVHWALGASVALGLAVGFLLNGSVAGIYATAPQTYPAHQRSSGVGIVLAFGRVGGMVSPLVAGYLLQRDWSISSVYMVYALVLLVSAGLLVQFAWQRKVA